MAADDSADDSAVEEVDPRTIKKRRIAALQVQSDEGEQEAYEDVGQLDPNSDAEVLEGGHTLVFDDDEVESDDNNGEADNGLNIMSLDPSTPQKPKKARRGKVAESDFTPRMAKVAKAAKIQARTRTATEDAFPGEAAAAAFLDIKRAVDRALGPDAVIFREALERLQLDLGLQDDVFTFVNYAGSGFRGEISAKIKDLFEVVTGIPGKLTEDEIIAIIKWLLTDMNYMYGDINVQAKTVNRSLPFHSPFIKPVITQVVFGKGKANRDAARTMISDREIPMNMYALVGAAIENTLKAWATGAFSPIPFSEEAGRESYLRHCSSFTMLQSNAPKFTRKMQFTLLKTILRDTGKIHLLDGYLAPDPGHLKGVDYEALEAAVESGEEEDYE
ncbi:hypothetical protein K523DRAFT_326111 [Schizophyllum commune Tattone D]|nr:hypothetical protein K523DRAFT_326111 [Schizophyllum commune Tattone D]